MATQRTHTVAPAVAAAASVHAAVTLTTVSQTVTTGITDPDVCRVLSITGNAAAANEILVDAASVLAAASAAVVPFAVGGDEIVSFRVACSQAHTIAFYVADATFSSIADAALLVGYSYTLAATTGTDGNNFTVAPGTNLYVAALVTNTSGVAATVTIAAGHDNPSTVMTGDVTVAGTDANGSSASDVIALNGNSTVNGVVAFATVTSITLPARTYSGDTVSIGCGDVFGLPGHIADTTDVTLAERMATGATTYTSEAIGSVNETYSTVASVIVAGDTMRWTYLDRGLDGRDISRLRRMVVEPDATTYSDSELAEYVEKYPLTDADGYEPDEDDWTETYDLNAAAAAIWYEKAAAHVTDYKFTADGSTFNRNEVYNQCMRMASRYASLAVPGSLEVRIDRDFERDYQSNYWRENGRSDSYIVNLAESDD